MLFFVQVNLRLVLLQVKLWSLGGIDLTIC